MNRIKCVKPSERGITQVLQVMGVCNVTTAYTQDSYIVVETLRDSLNLVYPHIGPVPRAAAHSHNIPGSALEITQPHSHASPATFWGAGASNVPAPEGEITRKWLLDVKH